MYKQGAESDHSVFWHCICGQKMSSINIGGNPKIKLILKEMQTKLKLDYKELAAKLLFHNR